MKLIDIEDDFRIPAGSIIRLYGVKRFDVMKIDTDLSDPQKQKQDFYDFILVDANHLITDTFILVNITLDNDNRGKIFGLMEGVQTRYFVFGSFLKRQFQGSIDNVLIETEVLDFKNLDNISNQLF